MAKVQVLIDGYARQTKGEWEASSTTALIEDNGKKILVDPGCHRQLLLAKLAGLDLKTGDIDMVFLTHYHPDHALLAGIFEEAHVLDGDIVYDGDKETEYNDFLPDTSVRVILTPGHTGEHASLLVETNKGLVAIAGDLFWWAADEKQDTSDLHKLIDRKDPFMNDFAALKISRKIILDLADWLIPGHGALFRVR